MQGLQAGPQAEQVQCKVHALAACWEIGKWSASMASSTWPPAPHGPHHCVYTAHATASGSAAVVTAHVNTPPSQEPRKVCGQWPPGFLPAGTGGWLWITARLRSCDLRLVTLNPHLPGPGCPEPHSLVPKCLSSEAVPQTRDISKIRKLRLPEVAGVLKAYCMTARLCLVPFILNMSPLLPPLPLQGSGKCI